MAGTKDITGQRFGRLVVLNRAQSKRGTEAWWLCRCDCGNEPIVRGVTLRRGKTVSCGCYGIEVRRAAVAVYRPKLRDRLRQYRHNARTRELSWNLSFEEFEELFDGSCAYCGLTPAEGVDRINNLLGYEAANAASCCYICNRAKNNLTEEQWKTWLTRIIAHNMTSS